MPVGSKPRRAGNLTSSIDAGSWSAQLDQLFSAHADLDRGQQMSRYMRDQYSFHGLSSARRRELQKQHEQTVGPPDDPIATAHALWALTARECQLAGVDVLNRAAAKLDANVLSQHIAQLVQQKSWWDTVDMLATNALSIAFKDRNCQKKHLPVFRQSSSFWMRRSALIFQLKYRENIDLELLFAIIDENLHSQEFFINKAIGWALRQHAKIDRKSVENFIASRDLAALSRREALR